MNLECPRSSLVRDSFTILDGVWDFAFDKDNKGERNNYQNGFTKERDILVPFTYQTQASGIGITSRCDFVWYQRHFNVEKSDKKRYILHLDGSDYVTKVFVNGKYVATGVGAYHRHSFDITSYLNEGDNLLVIKCEDDYRRDKLRGKQRSRDESYECYYVDTTGIYKSVWLEEVPLTYITSYFYNVDIQGKTLKLHIDFNCYFKGTLTSKISFKNSLVKDQNNLVDGNFTEFDISFNELNLWSLEEPNLYDLELFLGEDKVNSYVAFREFKSEKGRIFLNGNEMYLKLVLDQGYWKESCLSCPNVNELENDILKMKAFGFNGARKHQKIEDERFLYFADKLGYLVWVEVPSFYDFDILGCEDFKRELPYIIRDNRNHPSVMTYTLLNESWGIPEILRNKEQQDFTVEMYNLTKKIDPTRFVITNDGWEHTVSDIITFHHYEQDADKFYSYYKDKEKALTCIWEAHWKGAFAEGYSYQGQPIIFSEFGGTAFVKNVGNGNWGYGAAVKDEKEYKDRLVSLFKAIHNIPYFSGYCYTQVSDVEQEVNGLLDVNHEYKVDPEFLKEVQKDF